ncbi:MAG: hypothetical protein ABSF60_10170, partial [Verrucomicrobiota bacterium]
KKRGQFCPRVSAETATSRGQSCPRSGNPALRFSAFFAPLHFPVNSSKKGIALAASRRIIAINLPVVGKAACRTET